MSKPYRTNLPFLNREGALPADGWIHIVPKGVFPVLRERTGKDGKVETYTLQQVLDDTALAAMVNRFNEEAKAENFTGLRLDFEHFSYDTDKLSEAAGWIKEIQNRDNGLWGKVEWTDLGTTAITNKRYKLLSPVWMPRDCEALPGDRARPKRLDSVGLTNKPNLRGMVPLTNRDALASAESTQQTPQKNMNKIATALGLSADASEDAILAAIAKLQQTSNDAAPMANRVQALEIENKKLLAAQVDAALAPLKNRVSDEQIGKFRTSLIANREAVLPFVQELIATAPAAKEGVKPALQDPITNRAKADAPIAPVASKPEEHPFLNRARKLTEGGKLDFVQASEQLAKQEPALFEDYMNTLHGIAK